MRAFLRGLFWLVAPVALVVAALCLAPTRTECDCWDDGGVKAARPCSPATWEECRQACSEGLV
jgi:hypothetical protein